MIARAVPSGPGLSQQALDLISGQVISAAQMRIHRLGVVTLDKMPVGSAVGSCDFPLRLLVLTRSTLYKTIIL
ncbi:hypothetical protein [Paracoccus sp. (in: a-proteobacteria)]|uniref:hypothetical protein n=1 Tax=Paracoccus sp. TaxID=267 RepID=UPI0028B23EC7|nr:hypothetical protein [Paracoccus sp. (in: a-proteobacteria)]